ncbi:hypothetical protein [Methylorubrum extorquens]
MSKHLHDIGHLASLLKEMEDEPVQAVRRCKKEYQEDALLHSNCVASTIAFIVALIRKLDCSPSLRNDFKKEEIFDEDSRLTRKLSVGVARYILGAKTDDKAKYERARSYAEIANHFVDQAISPADVAAALMVTKPYTLLKQIKAEEAEETDEDNQLAPRRRTDAGVGAAAGPAIPKGVTRESAESVSIDIEEVDAEKVPRHETHAPPRPSKKPTARPKFDQETMIILEGMAFQNRVRNIGHGNAIWVKVRCEPLNEKWNRFLIDEARSESWCN